MPAHTQCCTLVPQYWPCSTAALGQTKRLYLCYIHCPRRATHVVKGISLLWDSHQIAMWTVHRERPMNPPPGLLGDVVWYVVPFWLHMTWLANSQVQRTLKGSYTWKLSSERKLSDRRVNKPISECVCGGCYLILPHTDSKDLIPLPLPKSRVGQNTQRTVQAGQRACFPWRKEMP